MNPIIQKNIVKELGLDRLPLEKQQKAMVEIGNIIFQRVILRVVEKLSPEEQEEMSKVMDQEKEQEGKLLEFLRGKISGFDEMVNEEVVAFKTESSELMSSARKGAGLK